MKDEIPDGMLTIPALETLIDAVAKLTNLVDESLGDKVFSYLDELNEVRRQLETSRKQLVDPDYKS